jgi:AraC-like DNA-binding protein
MRLLNTPPRDTVTELLDTLKVRASVYCLSDLRAPWGFEVDGANVAKFHLVLKGKCWLRAEGQDPVRLGAGELVILSRGGRHMVSDEPDSPVQGLDQIIADHPLDPSARLRYGGAGPPTRLLCGGFALADSMPARLIDMLPAVLQMDSVSTGVAAWLEPVFALLGQEAERPAPGAQAIFAKLADVFLTQALRAYLTGAGQRGLLRLEPMQDPQIEAAAALVKEQPGRPWTVQSLAREVGMSRTLFATRFRSAVGESPMRHLTKVRLGQAAGYLATTNLSLDAIARRTGYGNNAALSKAFKREFGVAPGAYRRGQGNVSVLPVGD